MYLPYCRHLIPITNKNIKKPEPPRVISVITYSHLSIMRRSHGSKEKIWHQLLKLLFTEHRNN